MIRWVTNRVFFGVACAVLLGTGAASAEDVAGETPGTLETEALREVFDLGRFHIKDLRPARNETVELNFVLHLALKPETPSAVLADLEGWKHRLRDQVITAARVAETKDFSSPSLHRLRRLMILRANRLIGGDLIDELLLTEFVFTLK
ncbi:MAG: hypothetical protein AAGA92_08090 [Planctomycetota bacterium]